ncbi:TRAP transporter substrate-binding protein DctP [Evansella clarkii]|uniref:TRAP transporter substrate-binding protein DctP n=1 Tax=Evansella clarkii TaxID=79879 RepID=UPI000997C94C|nr:TRAP transporter substrate-binding protein DctP [Evansella clarkii]
MKNKVVIPLIIIIFSLILAGCGEDTTASGDSADSTSLKIVSFLPENHQFVRDIIPMWIEKIEEGTNGKLELEWTAGPESIPTPDQFNAVSNGIVDIGFNTSSFYGHLMPETLSLHMSPYTPLEERENGYFDFLNERYNEKNQVYLGRFLGPNPFYFWTNEKISTINDFQGLQIRSNPTYHEILQALNATPVDVLPGEVYTSLERNMVDGFGFPLLGPYEDGWTEVTQYLVDEPFLNQNGTILINKDTFESLPEDVQEELITLTAEFEEEMYEHFNNENEKTWELLEEEGIERITLKEEDSREFQQIVDDVYWSMLERDAPDQIETLKSLLLSED